MLHHTMSDVRSPNHDHLIRLFLLAGFVCVRELVAALSLVRNLARVGEVASLAAHCQQAVTPVRVQAPKRQAELDESLARVVGGEQLVSCGNAIAERASIMS